MSATWKLLPFAVTVFSFAPQNKQGLSDNFTFNMGSSKWRHGLFIQLHPFLDDDALHLL